MNKNYHAKALLSVCIAAALGSATPAFSQPASQVKNSTSQKLNIDDLLIRQGSVQRNTMVLPADKKARAQNWLNSFNAQAPDLPFLRVNDEGSIYYADEFKLPQTSRAATPVSANITPAEDAFKLHSKLGASKIIYLDFNGHLVSGTQWSISDLDALPYDNDGDTTTFSTLERENIAEIWRRVAEDYSPFDVDVTTEEPASFGPTVGRVLITDNVDANGASMPASTAGGVAYVNVFGVYNYATVYSPVFVYYNNLAGGVPSYIAEAASHEMGHNMGLSHDATSTNNYYSGQGAGAISWGPIMGASFGRNVTQWSKGEYVDASQKEDDVAIIVGKVNALADDHADFSSQATPLTVDESGNVIATTPASDPNNTAPANKGVIDSQADVDVFSFTAAAGNVLLQATPALELNGDRGGNLDIQLSLYNVSGNLLASSNPADDTDAGINTDVPAGTYYLSVQGVGSVNYTDYGSLGQYFIDGTISVPMVDVTAPLPNPMGWSTAPQATDRFNLSMTAVTATDEASSVEYYFTCTGGVSVCTDSNWQVSPSYTATGLEAGTNYNFQVKARDTVGNETSLSSAVSATTQSNTAPVANNDTGEGNNIASMTIDVMQNDSDADGDTISITAVSQPSNGSATFDANGVSYTPNTNYVGSDTFTYTVEDQYGATATATVVINVTAAPNTAPIAADDAGQIDNSSALNLDVLSNDSDADGDSLSITNVGTPSNGTAIQANGMISYTPNAGFVGQDIFSYIVSDGSGGMATANVVVTVTDTVIPNTAPVAGDDIGLTNNTSALDLAVLNNDTDVDGDSLTIINVSQPSNGNATQNSGVIRYMPNAGFAGTDSFSYTISDGNGGSDMANVAVTVIQAAVENNKPEAEDDKIIVKQNGVFKIDVLNNDSDKDGDALEIVSVTQGERGEVSIENNQIIYVASDEDGQDEFTYTISDGRGGYDKANVVVSIEKTSAKNHKPVAKKDKVKVTTNGTVVIDVLENDKDKDGDQLQIISVTQGKKGNVSIENNQLVYVAGDKRGRDKFTYTVSDGKGGTATANVTVIIKRSKLFPQEHESHEEVEEKISEKKKYWSNSWFAKSFFNR